MTLLPVEPSRLTIDPRRYSWCPEPDVPDFCQVPEGEGHCVSRLGLQRHHIVRRSTTGGPLDYITIDGLVRQNVCRLCQFHHHLLTSPVGGHKAAIFWHDELGWIWCPVISPDLTGATLVCLAERPSGGVGAVFRTSRGVVLQIAGPLIGG